MLLQKADVDVDVNVDVDVDVDADVDVDVDVGVPLRLIIKWRQCNVVANIVDVDGDVGGVQERSLVEEVSNMLAEHPNR